MLLLPTPTLLFWTVCLVTRSRRVTLSVCGPFTLYPFHPQITRLREESGAKATEHAALTAKLTLAEAAEDHVRSQLTQLTSCLEDIAESCVTTEDILHQDKLLSRIELLETQLNFYMRRAEGDNIPGPSVRDTRGERDCWQLGGVESRGVEVGAGWEKEVGEGQSDTARIDVASVAHGDQRPATVFSCPFSFSNLFFLFFPPRAKL